MSASTAVECPIYELPKSPSVPVVDPPGLDPTSVNYVPSFNLAHSPLMFSLAPSEMSSLYWSDPSHSLPSFVAAGSKPGVASGFRLSFIRDGAMTKKEAVILEEGRASGSSDDSDIQDGVGCRAWTRFWIIGGEFFFFLNFPLV